MTLTQVAAAVVVVLAAAVLLAYALRFVSGAQAWLEPAAALVVLAGTYVVRSALRHRALYGPAEEVGTPSEPA
jgi:ABC-type nickel/cobalt efflux system permease component RcnA